MTAVVSLVDLAPGPALGAALARIDTALVPNDQLLPLLRAQSRQAAHEAARLLGVIAEVARANPACDAPTAHRLEQPSAYAADEVRAALAWSRRAAEGECELAEQLVHELPLVHGAFLRGEIDRSKVRVFAEHLGGLTPTQIEVICGSLVPSAGRLTPGQLMHRLRRLVAAVDPCHYERRYRNALRDRHLTAYLDEHGAAVLTARGLTPAQATAALERVDGLAHAVRRAGHPATLDQIRVDLLAGLLDGSLQHLSREEIVAHQITQHSADDRPTSGAAPPPLLARLPTTSGAASRFALASPHCWAVTSTPARSPLSVRYPPPMPARSSGASAARSGASRSPTARAGRCSTASPVDVRPTCPAKDRRGA